MIEKKHFGDIDGREVSLYIVKNDNLEVTLSDYGATIIRIRLTLKNGEVRDLVRRYDDLASYMNADGYLGAVVGRVGNRICRGKFTLDGADYELYCNNGVNHLHGGKIGCSECYNVFSNSLGSTVKRIHGNVEHCGKVPEGKKSAVSDKKKIEALKSKLNEAIEKQEYEMAAKYRDEIREIENNQKEGK